MRHNIGWVLISVGFERHKEVDGVCINASNKLETWHSVTRCVQMCDNTGWVCISVGFEGHKEVDGVQATKENVLQVQLSMSKSII